MVYWYILEGGWISLLFNFMECAILNYGVGSVDLVTVPDDIDDVEVYLYDVLGYREDEIEFMIKESKINIIDDRT